MRYSLLVAFSVVLLFGYYPLMTDAMLAQQTELGALAVLVYGFSLTVGALGGGFILGRMDR